MAVSPLSQAPCQTRAERARQEAREAYVADRARWARREFLASLCRELQLAEGERLLDEARKFFRWGASAEAQAARTSGAKKAEALAKASRYRAGGAARWKEGQALLGPVTLLGWPEAWL